MGVNVNAIQFQPTRVGQFNGAAFAPNVNGNHWMYTAMNCRVNLAPVINGGLQVLTPAAAGAGDTIFLPYQQNKICSLRLPSAAAATAAGINSFLTADMSGCMFCIDRITGSNDLIVYHANNIANSPAGNQGARNPTLQMPACSATLTNLYNTARAYYQAAPHNLNLVAGADLEKPVYNFDAQAEVMRKQGQHRANVEFTGGTIVFAVVNGANWDFYFQTWGGTSYDRPWNAPKGWIKGKHRDAVQAQSWEVFTFSHFF